MGYVHQMSNATRLSIPEVVPHSAENRYNRRHSFLVVTSFAGLDCFWSGCRYLRSRVSPTVDTSLFTSNASYFTRKVDFGKSLYLVRFYLLFCGEFFRLVVGAIASFHLLPLVICTGFKLYISSTRAQIVKSSPHQLL